MINEKYLLKKQVDRALHGNCLRIEPSPITSTFNLPTFTLTGRSTLSLSTYVD